MLYIFQNVLLISYLFFSQLHAIQNNNDLICKKSSQITKHVPFVKGSRVPQEIWEAVTPYLLPANFPIRSHLDAIFSKTRVTSDQASLEAAGFEIVPHLYQIMYVAKHSKLKGYIVKLYLDKDDSGAYDWERWIHRIEGVNQIRRSIERHGYTAFMKTPQKWIYPLPDNPAPLTSHGANFILIAEDMKIFKRSKNRKRYYTAVTPTFLDALYIILTENRLSDSIHTSNIPFCKDGKIAFVDTEHFSYKPGVVKYAYLNKYLNPQMQTYWNKLISQGGPH